MGEQTKRLSIREMQTLAPIVALAERHTKLAGHAWEAVGKQLDQFNSSNHSQCCPLGGNRMGNRSGGSGAPCPCGWNSAETVEDVLRRMVAHLGKTPDQIDVATADLVTDALAALSRTRT